MMGVLRPESEGPPNMGLFPPWRHTRNANARPLQLRHVNVYPIGALGHGDTYTSTSSF